MTPSQVPPAVLVTLLSAAVFLVRTAALMLGPLLVALASAFHSSVTAARHLALPDGPQAFFWRTS
jgi:predicted MFS family arabinose efflux permease